MGYFDSDFVYGAYNVICDICGKRIKSFYMKQNWKRQITCEQCWDPKPPEYEEPPIPNPNEGAAPEDAQPTTDYDYRDN